MATTKDRKKLVHIHSNVEDKQPLASALEVGELAVNNYAGKEFISLKNSDDKVVRFSSDGTLIDWVEKKEVFPYSGGVTDVNLNNGNSSLKLLMNQEAAYLSPHYESILNKEVSIDMSKYVLSGSNPTFSSITVNNNSVLKGTTTISGTNATIKANTVNISGGTSGVNISGTTKISGDTTVGGTLTVPNGLSKSASWSYGSVSAATNDSYNGSVDKSFTIPKSIDHLTNYDGTSINLPHNVTVNGTITANSGLTVNSGGASISGDVLVNGNISGTAASAGGVVLHKNSNNRPEIYGFDLDITADYYEGQIKMSSNGISLNANDIHTKGTLYIEDKVKINNGQTGASRAQVDVSAYTIDVNNYQTRWTTEGVFMMSGGMVDITATNSTINLKSNTEVSGTLDVPSGLTKSASWSYGNVSAATNDSYNGSANKSFTIPKSIEHLSNYSAGTVTLDDDIVIKKDLYVSGSIITTGSSAQQNLNLNYGDVRNASNATYNGATEKTVAIPKSIDHLTNYDGTAITMPHSVKVSGSVVANGDVSVIGNLNVQENVWVGAGPGGGSLPEVDFNVYSVDVASNTINLEAGYSLYLSSRTVDIAASTNGIHLSGDTDIDGATTISGNTTINGTLDAKSGLTKSASWSYGSVSAATSGSYNGSADKSVTIPKSIDHLTNYDGTSINLPHNVKVSGTISANSAIYSSDLRVKENVHGITDADIEKVANVHLNEFKFKDDIEHRTMYGVIAQEVNSAGLSSLVHIAEDGKLGVDYISFLILKIAELEKRIKELENSQK